MSEMKIEATGTRTLTLPMEAPKKPMSVRNTGDEAIAVNLADGRELGPLMPGEKMKIGSMTLVSGGTAREVLVTERWMK